VKKLSFTGSTAVGRRLASAAADAPVVKRLSLELGGNAPFVVCEDADLAIAVKAAVDSKFRNAGQTCVCSDRFLVHESVHDEFVGGLREAVEKLTTGEGVDDPDVGPLINPEAVALMSERVASAVAGGATLVTGGKPLDIGGGNFFAPTVLTDLPVTADCFRHENFGPVVAISRFGTDDEALEAIKGSSDAGLASYVMSESYRRIDKCVPPRKERGKTEAAAPEREPLPPFFRARFARAPPLLTPPPPLPLAQVRGGAQLRHRGHQRGHHLERVVPVRGGRVERDRQGGVGGGREGVPVHQVRVQGLSNSYGTGGDNTVTLIRPCYNAWLPPLPAPLCPICSTDGTIY
jgi:hypothetical protein